jgi:hypothetical protein
MSEGLVTVETNLLTQEWAEKRDRLILLAQEHLSQGITDETTLNESVKTQSALTKHIKVLNESRLTLTRKIDAVSASIRNQESELIADAVNAKNALRSANSSYVQAERARAERERAEQERRIAEEQAAREEAAAKYFGSAAQAQEVAPPPPPPPKPKLSAGRIVKRHKHEITDENALPRELLSPDPQKIRAYIKYLVSLGKPLDVPGLRITEITDVMSR